MNIKLFTILILLSFTIGCNKPSIETKKDNNTVGNDNPPVEPPPVDPPPVDPPPVEPPPVEPPPVEPPPVEPPPVDPPPVEPPPVEPPPGPTQDQNKLRVRFNSPVNNADIDTDTLTIEVQSRNANSVFISINSGTEIKLTLQEGIWSTIIEENVLELGSHTIAARAISDNGEAMASINLNVVSSTSNAELKEITYHSSVDAEPIGGHVYLPSDHDPDNGAYPLVIYLHGGGGNGKLSDSIVAMLETKKWIGLGPDGREWGLKNTGCGWKWSAAYVDSQDPNVGPGEQDILDAITWAQQTYNIDSSRIYLMGFSMGGRGTYAIGLKNPDLFAAIAPMAPASDMFEVFARKPDPPECKEGMTGGQPGDSPRVDTMYSITSGRFLLENAMNLPVFHAHGLLDGTAKNQPSSNTYLHGFHMTIDNTWNTCHGDTSLCFGHTPTLGDLHNLHPEGYDWAHLFTMVEHEKDDKWFTGTPMNSSEYGVENPTSPGNFLGIMDFFAKHTLVETPETIVYKTYTDTHQDAYWASIESDRPWQNIPAGVRASRNVPANSIAIELSRAKSIAIDLEQAGLSKSTELNITMDTLIEPVFDPALIMAFGEEEVVTLVLKEDFTAFKDVTVLQNGIDVSHLATLHLDKLVIDDIDVSKDPNLSITFLIDSKATPQNANQLGEVK